MLVFYSKLSTALLLQRLKSLEEDKNDPRREIKILMIRKVLARRKVMQ